MSDGYPPSLYFDQNKLYQWVCRGENCSFCNLMEGRVYKLDVYITSTVYPGFHKHCDCRLKEVPDGTPESDLDIFGSALNMNNEGWFEALFGDWDNLWMPGYITQPAELLKFAQPGMTAREAIIALNEQNKTGMFKNYGGVGDIFMGWNVWHNANLDLYQSFEDVITSIVGTIPKPAPLKPVAPVQSYHNTIYNLGW